jgi:hypothetical protein
MEALTTSLVVAVAVFLSSLIGLSLQRVVPEGHLSHETRQLPEIEGPVWVDFNMLNKPKQCWVM